MLDRKLKTSNPSILEAKNAADALANLTTGMDIFPIDIDKLVSAPTEWNFYSDLSDFKKEELVNSIRAKGLLHPLVVWQQIDNSYMILSGHSRKNAIVTLIKEFKDYLPEHFEEDKLLAITDEKEKPIFNFNFIATLIHTKKIHCYVIKFNEITEEIAKEIIVDTNWVQRELSANDKAKSILYKYTMQGRKIRNSNGEGKNEKLRDTIASELAISGRQVSNYMRLNYLIPPFTKLLNNSSLNIKAGVALSQFSEKIQTWIFDNYGEIICNKTILHLRKEMTKPQITQTLINKSAKIDDDTTFNKYVESLVIDEIVMNTIQIPKDKQSNFRISMLKFFKENNM